MDKPSARPLYGPNEEQLEQRETNADQLPLAVFQSFLYNQSADRQSISNAIVFWDWLPKYANEAVNSEPTIPNAIQSQFTYAGQRFDFTQFPGTCRDYSQAGSDVKWVRRYPGIKEHAVELALLKLTADEGGICELDQGQRQYGVVFSIRQLRRELEAMGHSYNHRQVVESIDILTSSEFLLESPNGKAVARSRIITEYVAAAGKGNARHSPEAQWRVFFHRVVAQAIETAQYRQYDLTRLYARRSYGITLVKRLIFTTNLSASTPLRVLFTELRETTSGLGYSRVTDGIAHLEKEIKRLKADRTLATYGRVIKRRSEESGRLSVVDAEFHLYPSDELVAEIKASNARHMGVEKTLMLSPRMRQERQMKLSLL